MSEAGRIPLKQTRVRALMMMMMALAEEILLRLFF